ncbi:Glyoxalase-like domain protein [Mycolicibacterium chlorophenolicum]|uniref:Glyoxalase-like domain protein n=2 Tax=Mycolicibacterium chlorophenolicum TaxID=37916 RepID=A0A0J6WMC9_9MYCO|nr:Glyoxalase-like domain protein [Mycolicibacterium chlorophenolicum]
MGMRKGLPGLRGGDHIGITVPDLEEATRFFVDVLGAEQFYDLGPLASDDDWMTTHIGVDRTARVEKLRFLRLGFGLNLELFEYTAPDQRRQVPLNSDIGGHHLALYVDDFSAALDYLRAAGVEIMGEPTQRTSGPSGGQTWIYFRAPWGLQMELVSYPDGKAYEHDFTSRLWDPRHPER